MVPSDLYNFRPSEFRHPEMIEPEAAYMLDQIRTVYDNPIEVTDDGRTQAEQSAKENPVQGGATGAVLPQLHLLGRAFDLRWPATSQLVFRLLTAVGVVGQDQRWKDRIELEIDATEGNKHVHVGLRPDKTFGSTVMIRKVA